MRRSIAGVGAAAIGAATTAAVLVLGTATGLAAPGTSSAFGVSASGLIPIEPTPSVESTDGTEQSDSLATVPLGELGEIAVAEVNAGNDTASVHLARVRLGMEGTGIEAKVINVACEGDTGTVNIVDLTVGGEEIVLPPPDQNPVNAQVSPVPEVLSIIYNQQMTNEDGTFKIGRAHV